MSQTNSEVNVDLVIVQFGAIESKELNERKQ